MPYDDDILAARLLLTFHYQTLCFLHHQHQSSRRRRIDFLFSSDGMPVASVHQNKAGYSLASADLSKKWIQLVREDKVSVTTTITTTSDDNEECPVLVRYGVRLDSSGQRCIEFAEQVFRDETEAKHPNPTIARINSTLTSMQKSISSSNVSPEPFEATGVKFVRDGPFAAQLQLVRTLRPPPSPGFISATSSKPPPYNVESDSFVNGPLRLEARPLIAELALPRMNTVWDIYHNVSPADARGHFLLLPSLKSKSNWRGQLLMPEDCQDIVHLASTASPIGSQLICFNSVGAGASQNHIHCHLLPSPPPPLQDENLMGWECYAASRITELYDSIGIKGPVEVKYLNYPCFCVQLSSVGGTAEALDALGLAVSTILKVIGDAPHNVCTTNRCNDEGYANNEGKENCADVDVYVFVRSKELSTAAKSLKLGFSEMMGVFHCHSLDQLDELLPGIEGKNRDDSPMIKALKDVSYELSENLWANIKKNLSELYN